MVKGGKVEQGGCWASRTAGRALLLVSCALGLLTWGAGPAGAANGVLSWSQPALIDQQAPFTSGSAIRGVSCPSTTLCLGVDDKGDVVVSTNPTGNDQSDWTIV